MWALTHWGRVTHICVAKLTFIDSDNDLSPARLQAIIWTNAGILWIRPFGTNFSEILIKISNILFQEKAFECVVCEMAAILSRPQCVKATQERVTLGLIIYIIVGCQLDQKRAFFIHHRQITYL